MLRTFIAQEADMMTGKKWMAAAAALGAAVTLVAAGGFARWAPLTKDGKQMVAAEGAKAPVNHVPSAAAVGVPAYPGALIVQTNPAHFDKQGKPGMYPTVTLVSNDSPSAVQKFYAARLNKTWHYHSDMHTFVKGKFSMRGMFTEPHVAVTSLNKSGLAMVTAFFKVPHAKTKIEIAYPPPAKK